MDATTVGADLAKNVFVACVADCAGRIVERLGLTPRLMVAEFVRPYRKRQWVKHDRADAEAILITLRSPGMRFIPVKTEVQQQRLAWHSLRLGWVQERTALLNRVRGLLAEFGLIVDPAPGICVRCWSSGNSTPPCRPPCVD